jgi:hypothetical protein
MSERAALYRFTALTLGGYLAVQPWVAWSWQIWGGFMLLLAPVVMCAVLDRHERLLSERDQESRRVPSSPAPMTTYESARDAEDVTPPTTRPGTFSEGIPQESLGGFTGPC